VFRACLLSVAALALAVPASSAFARPRAKPKSAEPPPVAAAPVRPAPPPPPAHPTLATLVSASDEEVKSKLGTPDIARKEGASAMWTYSWRDCALLVFFKSPDGRTLRVSGASAGPRRRGQATPTVDACLAQHHASGDTKKDEGAIDALLAQPG
jgi:hypothetical protein